MPIRVFQKAGKRNLRYKNQIIPKEWQWKENLLDMVDEGRSMEEIRAVDVMVTALCPPEPSMTEVIAASLESVNGQLTQLFASNERLFKRLH